MLDAIRFVRYLRPAHNAIVPLMVNGLRGLGLPPFLLPAIALLWARKKLTLPRNSEYRRSGLWAAPTDGGLHVRQVQGSQARSQTSR